MTLKELRLQSKKTAAEIATVLGVSRNAVTNYELGARRIDIEQVITLAELYDVSVSMVIRAQLNSCNQEKGTRQIVAKQHTRLYRVYRNIIQRCTNPNCPDFKYYGQRGVKICDEWIGKTGFSTFYEWALSNGYNENANYGECTIDRINANGNYEPTNCRWVSFFVQNNNRRNNEI